jgi:hypothetical protein
MKSILAALLAAGLISTGPTSAALVSFETPTSFGSINHHYNGGVDSGGLTGTYHGIWFNGDALAVQNDSLGPYFSNAPSPLGVMAPVGADATMNVAAGFAGVASLYYSALDTALVNIWSGYDGTGSLLGAFNLTNNAQNACNDSPFCNWTLASVNLGSNVARSITFGSAANIAGFDNVSVEIVPVPAALPLLAFGLAGMGAFMRRRKQVAV